LVVPRSMPMTLLITTLLQQAASARQAKTPEIQHFIPCL
jgi:hypothetical protein